MNSSDHFVVHIGFGKTCIRITRDFVFVSKPPSKLNKLITTELKLHSDVEKTTLSSQYFVLVHVYDNWSIFCSVWNHPKLALIAFLFPSTYWDWKFFYPWLTKVSGEFLHLDNVLVSISSEITHIQNGNIILRKGLPRIS